MAELDHAIDWALSRSPKRFYNFTSDYYLWKLEQMTEGVPAVVIIYKYDETEDVVHLLDISEASAVASSK
jgi:hypothetical protein